MKRSDDGRISRCARTHLVAALVGLGGILTVPGTGNAAVLFFADDFNRPNTVPPSTNVGPGWVALNNDGWVIQNHTLVRPYDGVLNLLLAYEGFTLPAQFAISTDLKLSPGGGQVGLYFNIQDTSDYYSVKLDVSGAYHLLKTEAGTITEQIDGTFTETPGSWYTATVTMTNAGAFVFSIVNRDTATLLSTSSMTDSGSPFTGGYGGLWQTYGTEYGATFDNFSITELVPEPSSLVLLVLGGLVLWRRPKKIE